MMKITGCIRFECSVSEVEVVWANGVVGDHIAPVVTMSFPTPTGRPPTNDTVETLPNAYRA